MPSYIDMCRGRFPSSAAMWVAMGTKNEFMSNSIHAVNLSRSHKLVSCGGRWISARRKQAAEEGVSNAWSIRSGSCMPRGDSYNRPQLHLAGVHNVGNRSL